MKKYLLRYMYFWLPAAVAAMFFNHTSMLSQALQWVFAALMVVGWAVNTGMCAYHYPRTALSLILFYTGISIFSITLQYSVRFGTPYYAFVRKWVGLFSFKPLDIIVVALLDFRIRQEAYVVGALVAFCLAGYLIGLVYRRMKPNPYHPRIVR